MLDIHLFRPDEADEWVQTIQHVCTSPEQHQHVCELLAVVRHPAPPADTPPAEPLFVGRAGGEAGSPLALNERR